MNSNMFMGWILIVRACSFLAGEQMNLIQN